ncbi:MAG: ATP-binding cassette domain-containing protein [Gemmatimonadaceae bacterium]|jgi:ABC-2 type transport system ATP-binding protein|nr:ATP-binding cassette domain-containing protein [Gemmatimonadaceae bacterium]
MTSALSIDHIAKRYEQHVAVHDLSLEVPRGTLFGLLGPNGAGKTTTIRMLLNIIRPDRGTIRVLDTPFDAPGLVNRIGYLPEERGLYKKMQVRRVLRFLGELKGIGARDADRRIDHWLERLSLSGQGRDWGSAKVEELSRGMQQKVQFIGALLHDPELVILDEPFSGLDPINAQAMKDTMVDLRTQGRTVIFSTHIMDNAERLCDAVCIIARGEKVLDGGVAAVRAAHGARTVAVAFSGPRAPAVDAVLADRALVASMDDQNRFLEIVLADGAEAQQLLVALVAAGAPIERFERVRPSLHRIFLEKVGATGVEAGMSGQG